MRRWWGRAIVACCYALAQRRCISALTPRQQASPAGGFPSSRCGEGIVGTKYGPAFIHPSTRARACGLYSSSTPSPSSAPASSPVRGNAKPTLDQRTAWRLDLLLRNPGSVNATEASVRLRFIERANYEPPQGALFVEEDRGGLVRVDSRGFAEQGDWTLSEDKDDRKWGLWIWGLFEEPLYPYLYVNLPVYDELVDGTPLLDGQGVPRGVLQLRFDHSREDGRVGLSNGKVTYRTVEMMKADPLGLGGMVNVGEEKDAGEAAIRPAVE